MVQQRGSDVMLSKRKGKAGSGGGDLKMASPGKKAKPQKNGVPSPHKRKSWRNPFPALEAPFEFINASAADSHDSSCSCTVFISVKPAVCCDALVSATATAIGGACTSFATVVITNPLGDTQSGFKEVNILYPVNSVKDCGKTISFQAAASCQTGVVTAYVDVVRAIFLGLKNTKGPTEFKPATNEHVTGRYFSAATKFEANIGLQPQPAEINIPYAFRLSQFMHTSLTWNYQVLVNGVLVNQTSTVADPPGRDVGFDGVPQKVSYKNGVVTVTGEDQPGKFFSDAELKHTTAIGAIFNFNLFIEKQCKADIIGGAWEPIGKLQWNWIGGVTKDGDENWKVDGGIEAGDGNQDTGPEGPPKTQ